jgi:hypothetical protein
MIQNKNIQQEIKFFWPLTEQIPLNLIYEDCNKPLPIVPVGTLLISNGGTGASITSGVTIDCDQISFQPKKKHTFLQRLMYKAMGIKVLIVK